LGPERRRKAASNGFGSRRPTVRHRQPQYGYCDRIRPLRSKPAISEVGPSNSHLCHVSVLHCSMAVDLAAARRLELPGLSGPSRERRRTRHTDPANRFVFEDSNSMLWRSRLNEKGAADVAVIWIRSTSKSLLVLARRRTGGMSAATAAIPEISGRGATTENNVTSAVREPSRRRIFAARRRIKAPGETGVGSVGSLIAPVEDLGADVRRCSVNDRSAPTNCDLSPLTAGNPVDAHEREQKARPQ
jgi:hypothetical protein